MRIITGGKPFIDSDAYGGMLAYAELLNKQGIAARPVSTSVFNASITPTVLSWKGVLETEYRLDPADTFTLIDNANLDYLDPIVDIDRIDEIIDHHPGFEAFWRAKIGAKAHIELVGAACTLVCEHWLRAGLIEQMSQTSARSLICGILDNTLNFGAKITTDRDHQAYQKLLTLADLPKDWTARYFAECQAGMLHDIQGAINNDFKVLEFSGWTDMIQTGQLGIWNAQDLLGKHLPAIKSAMAKKGEHWFMNIIAMSEGRSYLICTDPGLKEWLSELLGLHFKNDIAVADRMWLRKEITKQALDKN